MEMMDVVDEHDVVLRQASIREVYDKLLNHRIVHVLVFDGKGRMLFQLRSTNMSYRPGFWATSAGGHVRAGENYKAAAQRELQEELGIVADLKPFSKDVYEGPRGMKKFLTTFKASHEGPFAPDPAEVERVAFFNLEEIREMLLREKIHPELLFLLQKHFLNVSDVKS